MFKLKVKTKKKYYYAIVIFIVILKTLHLAHAQEIAITIDDPNCGDAIFFSKDTRDKKILSALNKHDIQAAFFVVGSCVDNTEGTNFLKRWDKAGVLIGNHTYSHESLNKVDVKIYMANVKKNEKLLEKYANYRNIFRFPYLKEGDSVPKRDQFRLFLNDNKYALGHVTIDASDWYISNRLEKRLIENPNANIEPFKKYYLKHMWNRAKYYDDLAVKVIGRSPKHTLLMHHNLLNALFLDDLIQMFKNNGWKVIDAEVAFRDPIYKMAPNIIPAGEGIIWAIAKETKKYDDELRYPAEDEIYEKNIMDKLKL